MYIKLKLPHIVAVTNLPKRLEKDKYATIL